MNYGKKDEDADTGLVRVDRTQVFQEGQAPRVELQVAAPYQAHMLINTGEQRDCSTARPYSPEDVESS